VFEIHRNQAIDMTQPIHNRLSDLLDSPHDDCRPYPFWFWNGRLTDAELTWQLEACRQQHITTVLIHPRHGLVTPYLSDDYFARVVHTVNECKRLGMKVWLYDEYNWPSGVVAGRLLRDYPHYRMRYLHFDYREHDGGTTLTPKEPLSSEFPALHAVDLSTGERRTFSPGETLPEGRWGVAEFHLQEPTISLDAVIGHSHAAPLAGYLDVMNPDAVAKFIELTHSQYERHLKAHFGTTVLGFFTDEPGLIYDFTYDYDFGYGMTHNVPWTAEFEEHFAEKKGYSIRDRLMDLLVDTPHAGQTRQDFWQVLSQRYGHAYHRQLSHWCESRSLAYTGHVCCEEMLLHYQGDIHEPLQHFHIPGTDWTSRACTLDSAPMYVMAKTASSVSRRYGRRFTMCETYGAAGWAVTLSDMRRVVDYLYALGINQMCLHGFFYNLLGSRTHECPPSEFFQSPMWKYMAHYSDYTARLGTLLTQGRHLCSLGVVMPIRSWQSRNVRTWLDSNDPSLRHLQAFSTLIRALLENGIDFEMLPDSAISDALIDSAGLRWGDEHLHTLIVPPCATLDADLQSQLDRFANVGGRIIAISDVSGQVSPSLCRDLSEHRVQLRDKNADTVGTLIHRRQLDDASQLCFVCNATDETRDDAEVSLPGLWHVNEIDIERAEFAKCTYVAAGDRTTIETTFLPHQARMFQLTHLPQPHSVCAAAPQISAQSTSCPIPLPTEWAIVADRDNVYRIDSLLHIHLPEGQHAEVHARVASDVLPKRIQLLLEGDAYTRITVNHVDVSHRLTPCRYFDSDQYAIDIADLLHIGENRISMHYRPAMEDTFISGLMTCAGITTIQPHLFLIGEFSVTAERHLASPTTSMKLGRWQEQGFPDYAGTITYRTTFSLAADEVGLPLTLTCDVAEGCVEVILNDTPLATRLWAPYTVDLAAAARVGDNVLHLAVTNTASDLLRPWPAELDLTNPQAFLANNNRQHPDAGLLAATITLHPQPATR
jgi:hypothetical protein